MQRASASSRTVAVYGATGYTGQRVAREIRARGAEVLLVGRNADALAALGESIGASSIAATLDDRTALLDVARRASVLVNCAGPFSTSATTLADVAVEAGAHYVDVSAEQGSAKALCDGFDTRARRAGVAILPAHAFYAAVADALASIVADELGPLDRLDIAYRILRWHPPEASFHSRIEGLRRPWYVWNDGLETCRWWPATTSFDFGGEAGHHRVTAYPTADVVLLPRHIDARAVDVRLTAETLAPAAMGRLLPHLANAARVLVATPARCLVEFLFGVMWRASAKTGAAADETAFDVVVRGTSARGERRARASGVAIYDLTAKIVADAALSLDRGEVERAGVLSPAQFLEPRRFLQALGGYGIAIGT